MSLKFKDILSEGGDPKKDRFVEKLLPVMKNYFIKQYPNGHWVNGASWMGSHDVNVYRSDFEKSKVIATQLTGYLEKLKNTGKHTPKQVQSLWDSFYELTQEYTTLMNRINHIGNLFDMGRYGNDSSFVEKLAIPLEILLDVWERFYEEVYKPGVVEERQQRDGLGLEYGLPDGDYSDIGTYGKQHYRLMKDNQSNEFILIINRNSVDWSSKGMDYDEIYYKRFKTKQEVKSLMVDREFKDLKNELYGAEVEYTDEEVQRSYDYLEHNDVRLQEIADEDYEGELAVALSEKLVYPEDIIQERRNQWGSDALSLSKYLIRTYSEIKSFNF